MTQQNERHTTFREIAGIITAMIVVLLFSGLGIIQVAVFLMTGTSIAFDPDYKTALLGLASMALGFLVGSQSDNKTNTSKYAPTPTTTYTSTIEATTTQSDKPTV
jgi:hypothetical protein